VNRTIAGSSCCSPSLDAVLACGTIASLPNHSLEGPRKPARLLLTQQARRLSGPLNSVVRPQFRRNAGIHHILKSRGPSMPTPINIRGFKLFVAALSIALLSACSTHGKFVIPEGTTLYLGGRPEPVNVAANGTVTVHAFGWDSMGVPPEKGIEYRLEKDGQTVQEGRLRARLLVRALFVPPIFGIIFVPTGLNPQITYNLVTGKQE